MYHDFDPLLQEDGTLLTHIDIVILRFAKLVAGFFLKPDEEDYTASLRRMLTFGGVYFGLTGVVSLVLLGSIKFHPFFLFSLFLLVFGAWKGTKCHATGTVKETQQDKLGALSGLLAVPTLTMVAYFLPLAGKPNPTAFSFLIISGGVGIWYIAFVLGYVLRLGEPPRKRERVKVLKLVFYH